MSFVLLWPLVAFVNVLDFFFFCLGSAVVVAKKKYGRTPCAFAFFEFGFIRRLAVLWACLGCDSHPSEGLWRCRAF